MVFDRVIQEVCDSSQIDFEESGVDQHTLEELRKVDLPSGDVFVKTEGGFSPPPPGPPGGTSLAQQRAANALHQKYGTAAANQVQHLQSHSQAALSLPGGQPRFQPPPMGNSKPQDFRPVQQQTQAQGQAQAQGQGQVSRLPQTGIQNSQTDGAGDDLSDWKAEVQRRREAAAKNGPENDRRLREFVESRNLQLEGGGLLAPLHERYPNANGKKRKIVKFNDLTALSNQAEATSSTISPAAPSGPPPPSQFDGTDDYGIKKDEDEDAINSDLDDPDDLVDDEQGEDDAVGQVMLCTYDKVQRVKSKWKCVLKDGILTSDGRE
ncbi:uncharacterized protein GIQ15_04038 [Arthroderma uncinatum]|uniref:uncharacterized protein n=1 Tax=Arthroderma uncinatum TaxID=74035 RepID=UPI00144A947E|nr:uncharacterized protein GIQ15_04038 [Arthroderma uncinatum]KAF3481279.1 hypothetical protein GIQ15_04038 [Arthroderma uncinatum]